MPKPKEPESFEKLNDTPAQNNHAMLYQVARNMPKDRADSVCNVTFISDNIMKLMYQSLELHIHQRKRQVEEQAKDIMDDHVKKLKKAYKEAVGKVLNIKELKDKAYNTAEGVNLNSRYMYTSFRFYELGEDFEPEYDIIA